MTELSTTNTPTLIACGLSGLAAAGISIFGPWLRTLFPQPQQEQVIFSVRSNHRFIQKLGEKISENLLRLSVEDEIHELLRSRNLLYAGAEYREFYHAMNVIADKVMTIKDENVRLDYGRVMNNLFALKSLMQTEKTRLILRHAIEKVFMKGLEMKYIYLYTDIPGKQFFVYQGDERICNIARLGKGLKKKMLDYNKACNMHVINTCIEKNTSILAYEELSLPLQKQLVY